MVNKQNISLPDTIKPPYPGTYNAQNFQAELVLSGYSDSPAVFKFNNEEKLFRKFLFTVASIIHKFLKGLK